MIYKMRYLYNLSVFGFFLLIYSCSNGEAVPKHKKPSKKNKEIIHSKNESNEEKDSLTSENQDEKETLNFSNSKVENIKLSTLDHSVFDLMLQNYVSNEGSVNYKKWKADIPRLKQYVNYLGEFEEINSLNKKEKLAYWINLYNSSTILMILENYPIESITKLENGKPWDKKWIRTAYGVISLNDIENKIIRPEFADPRIHFALNCAAKSCPPLWNHVFIGKSLDVKLKERTQVYLQSKAIQLSEEELKLSKIFEWYSTDFGELRQFISTNSNIKVNKEVKISYLEYDWSLNE